MASQLGKGPGRHRPAAADDGHAVGQRLDLTEDVARQQDGAALLAPLAHDLLERLLHERVETGTRLVEHKQIDVGGQGGDEGDLLSVALRVVANPLRRIEVEPVDERCPASVIWRALRRSEDIEALATRQPGPERDIAGDVREPGMEGRRLAPRVGAEELDETAAGTDEPEEDPDRCRLAGSIRAEEAVDLARGNVEVEAVEGLDLPERFRQPVGADDRLGCIHRDYSFAGSPNAPSA